MSGRIEPVRRGPWPAPVGRVEPVVRRDPREHDDEDTAEHPPSPEPPRPSGPEDGRAHVDVVA